VCFTKSFKQYVAFISQMILELHKKQWLGKAIFSGQMPIKRGMAVFPGA